MLKRLHNIRGGALVVLLLDLRKRSAAAVREARLFITADTSMWDTCFFSSKHTRFPSVSSIRAECTFRARKTQRGRERERERREKEKEGRERKALRAIAKGIYAMLSVTLRSPHRKIAKLFKTPLAASVLVAV